MECPGHWRPTATGLFQFPFSAFFPGLHAGSELTMGDFRRMAENLMRIQGLQLLKEQDEMTQPVSLRGRHNRGRIR